MNAVERPSFFEGQILAAADLDLAVDYARETAERHAREAHTPGVVRGMTLTLQNAAAGGGAQDAFVTEGLAVDALGRQIVVTRTTPVLGDPLHGAPDGTYAVFAWLSEVPVVPAAGANPCATAGTGDRVQELASVAVLLDTSQAQSLSAVCVGSLPWSAAKSAFVAGATTAGRHGGGVRAHEIVAAEREIVVHPDGGDDGPATLTVQGAVKAVAAGDGTRPVVRIPGGTLELCASDSDPATRTVALGHAAPTATSDAMVVVLGNSDPKSALQIVNPGGVVASIDGSGTVHGSAGAFDNVTASASVAVGSGDDTLTLAATPPAGRIGVQASHTLPLAFGTASGDTAMFVAGATPVVVVDATTLTVTAKQLALGTVDASSAGLVAHGSDHLELRTAQGDVVLNPGTTATPFLRFTKAHRVLNQAASSCDVTPVTATSSGVSVLRMGPLAVMFCAPFTVHNAQPLSQTFSVSFSPAFAAAPAFFVNARVDGLVTVGAAPMHVDANGATYRIVRSVPDPPGNGQEPAWSGGVLDVIVSWIALGTIP